MCLECWNPKPIKTSIGQSKILEIFALKDKIIGKSLSFIIEAAIDDIFLDVSTSLRRRKNCHFVLAKIKRWNNIKWFIKGKILKFSNSMNHHILEKVLNSYISDQ